MMPFFVRNTLKIKEMFFILTDKRLLKCAKMVSGKGKVCDVGTDHAYLPAYLVKNGICESAVAADIADGPLRSAKATLEKFELLSKIELVKSDGLKEVNPENITDVIIAGMGAETISNIINDAEWLKNDVNIIVQPMTKITFMRKWIYENGYEIVREEAVTDNDFVYTVMVLRYSGYHIKINELSENLGKFDFSKDESKNYVTRRIKQLSDISEGIKKSGKSNPVLLKTEEVIKKMNDILDNEYNVTVGDVYDIINSISPFSTQDDWDNSGLLVGDKENIVTGVLVALDITNDVIEEAVRKKANLIISHHPIIFRPIKKLSSKNPAVKMVSAGISAICVHTPIDMAVGGINDIIVQMLKEKFEIKDVRPLIPLSENSDAGTGRIAELSSNEINAETFAQKLREIFGCMVVRYTCPEKSIRKVGICSGSGGSLLGEVMSEKCDAYITGDVKHDIWIDAYNNDIALFDCGHYHTEKIVVDYIVKVLTANLTGICIQASEACRDVVSYVFGVEEK